MHRFAIGAATVGFFAAAALGLAGTQRPPRSAGRTPPMPSTS